MNATKIGLDEILAMPLIDTPERIVDALCVLQDEVAERFQGYREPVDCFCKKRGDWPTFDPVAAGTWRNNGTALRFIVNATRKALEQHEFDMAENGEGDET